LLNRLLNPKYWLVFCLALIIVAAVIPRADAQVNGPDNYIKNGSFAESANHPLSSWTQLNAHNLIMTGTEGADTYALASTTDVISTTGITQTVPISSEWSKVLLRGEVRAIFQGSGASPFLGVSLNWLDKSGQTTPETGAQSWLYTTPGWVEINQLFDVPSGAIGLIVAPQIANANATAYFKDLSLVSFVTTFKDDFAGSAVDPTRWSITTGKHNVAGAESEWFSPDEILVANNMLRIHAENIQSNGFAYQSGQISSIGKFQQRYGLFEFQCKLPVVSGAWPAAYLLPWNDDWPPEIDVEELAGDQPEQVINTNHYTDEYGVHQQSQVNYSANGIDRTQWHSYAVVWEPGQAAWYLDGIYKGTTGQPYDNVSDVPMYITINFAVGGFGGDPSQSSWPQDYFCREAAAYQRTDLPLPLYPEDSQEITLPTTAVTLSAISGNPSNLFRTTWRLIDGPGQVKIRNPHQLTTTVTMSKPGMYRFSIMVTKGEDSTSAQLLVYVNSALGGH
jgi:hypothetical protein